MRPFIVSPSLRLPFTWPHRFTRIAYGLLLGLVGLSAYARGEEPVDPPKGKVSPSPARVVGLPVAPARQQVSAQVSAELDEAMARLNPQLAAQAALLKPDAMTNLPVVVGEQAESDRSTARKLMSYLDKNPDKVKALTDLRFEDLMVCPVGLRQTLGDGSAITIGILKAEFGPQYAELTIFARLQFTTDDPGAADNTRDLFLGVDKVRFTREGGLAGGGTFRVVLLGDFVLPMKSWTVILKGGTGIGTPALESQTYVDIQCNSFKEASLAAQLIFPRNVLVPFDATTRKPIAEPARVGVDFAVKTQSGLRNLLASVTIANGQAFAVASFPRFGFRLQQLVVDLSDAENATAMVFPRGYTGDMDGRWRGVYVKNFAVLLPNEFKPSTGGGGIDLGARDVLVDRTGFSGGVTYRNTSQPTECNANGWKLTLSAFDLEFLQNKPQRGAFAGQIFTPIATTGFSYAAIINPTDGLYSASVRTEGDLPVKIPAWRAYGKIYRGSQVSLDVKNDTFYPKARLSGEFSIGTKIGTTATVKESEDPDTTNGTATLKQIQFTGLFLQTESPYVAIGSFQYNDKDGNKMAGFPISITKVGKSDTSPKDGINIDFGFKVSLAQDRISGATELQIQSTYEKSTGQLRFAGVTVKKLVVHASTTAMDMDGYLEIYDNNVVKGFNGGLDVTIKNPFTVNVTANASFGYHKLEAFRYGYVDVYAQVPGRGVPIGFAGLNVNGVGLGVYFNMKPKLAPTGIAANAADPGPGCFKPLGSVLFTYCPDRQIPFGFKAMLGLNNALPNQTQGSFQGRVSLEFALDRTYGINSVALAGNGVFGAKPESKKVTIISTPIVFMGRTYGVATTSAETTISDADYTKNALGRLSRVRCPANPASLKPTTRFSA